MKPKDTIRVSHKINFRISGLNIALISSDPSKVFLFDPSYRRFISKCRHPDIRIRVCYGNFPKLNLSSHDFLAQIDGWWSFYARGRKRIFCLPRVRYLERSFIIARKKVMISRCRPEIIISKEPSDFSSRNTLLPLPRRLAVFGHNFKKGTIHIAMSQSESTVRNPLEYPLLNLMLLELLHHHGGLIFHACGIVNRKKQCYLFLGHSGDGKSTMARLWKDDAYILDDDRVPVKMTGNSFFAYPAPGSRENSCSCSITERAKISGIFFLEKDTRNKIGRLNNIQALSKLVEYTPAAMWDRRRVASDISLLKHISTRVPCYVMKFYPDKRIVRLLSRLHCRF